MKDTYTAIGKITTIAIIGVGVFLIYYWIKTRGPRQFCVYFQAQNGQIVDICALSKGELNNKIMELQNKGIYPIESSIVYYGGNGGRIG